MLKSVEMHGFKSFARPTRLEFPPGISALVGPNGTGKSNVVDAVRWSLGEQSIRDLRGQRGADVIYGGPRRILGAAEVSLTLENDLEDPDSRAETCISRRLYRSGDSEYLLNRRKARLKDVLETMRLLDIEAGRRVIVTQGMTDSLLSASPLERRTIIEQSAGLSGYRERRDEARQKLAAIYQNIATTEMVLAELEPRLRLVRRQARAVEERGEAAQRLRNGLVAWYGFRWRELQTRSRIVQEETNKLAADRAAVAAALENLEKEAESALDRERSWHQRIEAAVAALHLSEREEDGVRREIEYLEHRSARAKSGVSGCDAQLRQLQSTRSAIERRLEVAGCAMEEMRAVKAVHENRVWQIHSELASLRAEVATAEGAASEIWEARDAAESRHTRLVHLKQQAQSDLARDTARSQQLTSWIQHHETSLRTLESELSGLTKELSDSRIAEASCAAEHHTIERKVTDVRHRSERLEQLQHRTRLARNEAEAKLRTVRNMLGELDADPQNALLAGLTVNPPWERAVASSLGDWGLAGKSSGVELRSTDLSSFLVWRRSLDQRLHGRARWADAEVSGFPADSANPLSSTLLARSEEEAADLWREIESVTAHLVGSPPMQVVAASGRCWSAVGVRQARLQDPNRDYLIAKRDAVALSRRLALHERRLSLLDRALESTHELLRSLQQDLARADARLRSARSRRADLDEARQRTERRQIDLRAEQAGCVTRLGDLRPQIDRAQTLLESLEEAECNAERERAAAHLACEEAERVVVELRSGESALVQDLVEPKRAMEVLEAKQSMQAEIVASTRDDLTRIEVDEQELSHRRHQFEADIQRFEDEIGSARGRLDQLAQNTIERSRAVQEMRKRSPGTLDQKEALREARQRLSAIVSQHERSLAALLQLESEKQGICNSAWQELGAHPGALPAAEHAPDESEIRRLRARAMQFADADPSVIFEHQELSERRDYLRRQLDDLQRSADNLGQIMRHTDHEMSVRFRSAFTSISEMFSDVFRMMFRGGEARLEQIDADGGVEVRAQLPGRRNRSSAAFSGGERALVASSLLFGVLHYRPTPFCILDEVDAALDESNVDRYLSVLREMSRRTQMIVVTHNRATMAAADVLYGLTMDDEGVSRVLSLRLDMYDAAM